MSNARKNLLKPRVVYQDNNVFLINKPGGWVTLNVKTFHGPSLETWVKDNLEDTISFRGGIVHRLDKDTFGLVLGAKDKSSFDFLQNQFKNRQVEKMYLALVRGKIKSDGQLVSPVGRLPHNKLKRGVVLEGKSAQTKFAPLWYYQINNQDYTLVKVWPKTGRTHQIRVHFKHLGHPLYGDEIYGGKNESRKVMFLFAKKIKFVHPKTKKEKEFEIDLPINLKSILNEAEKKSKN